MANESMSDVLTIPSRKIEEALQSCLEPVRHPDVRSRLREIAKELKHRDGEHWAVGELVERVCIFMDAEEAGLSGFSEKQME